MTLDARYRTLLELGRGGMGVVELAEARDGSLVAVKRALPELSRDERARSAFLREARLLSRIDHPNVVRVVEVDPGDEREPPAIVMQLVDGASLRELLAVLARPLPIDVAAFVGVCIARGLHAAHELCDEQGRHLGVVHRDVSPHNVVITWQGQVKLLDFGVAKTTEATRSATGEVKGKLSYMAPEQAMGDPVDRRSDVYAIGAVLFELLTGQRVHGEGTDLEILKRMATSRPRPLAALRPDAPEGLAALVDQMLSELPDDRPATAEEVAVALSPWAQGVDEPRLGAFVERSMPEARALVSARLRRAPQPTTATRSASHGRRRPAVLAAALAGLVLAGAALVAARSPDAPAVAATPPQSPSAQTPSPPASQPPAQAPAQAPAPPSASASTAASAPPAKAPQRPAKPPASGSKAAPVAQPPPIDERPF